MSRFIPDARLIRTCMFCVMHETVLHYHVGHVTSTVCSISSTLKPPDEVTTVEDNCRDGQLRLVNGSNPLEGRVEVCFNRAWGTLCDTGFSEEEAEVVCRQVGSQFGYAHGGSIPLRNRQFGEGSGPIFIDTLGCSGSEKELIECSTLSVMGFHQCDHSQDAGVICEG